jgi:hypothetical protein
VVLLGAAITVASVMLIVDGNRHSEAHAAPLPTRQFSNAPAAPPGQPASDPPPDGGPATTYGSPNHLYIRSLHVAAPLVDEALSGGSLTIPGDVHRVGRWVGGAALDGKQGTVLLAGHVNYGDQGNGALYSLYSVQPGAVVVTTDAHSHPSSWRVTGLQVIDKANLSDSVFAPTGPRRLLVVTCGGPLITVTAADGSHYRTYRDNVVATAVPVRPSG